MPADLNLKVVVTLPTTTIFAGTYELELGKCTGRDDLDCRRETGYSLIGLFEEVQKDGGLTLTVVCMVAWLVRRKQFPQTTFEDILSTVPWGADFTFDIPGVTGAAPTEVAEDEDEDSGKAPGSENGSVTSSPPSHISMASPPGVLTT